MDKNDRFPHECQCTFCPELILSSPDLLIRYAGKFMHMLSSTVGSDEIATGTGCSIAGRLAQDVDGAMEAYYTYRA